jgi:hypothetical protein
VSEVEGSAGETREISFEAPPAPPVAPIVARSDDDAIDHAGRPPLSPVFTWIGVGLTVALGAATIVSGLNAKAGVPEYEKAAKASRDCMSGGKGDCSKLAADAAARLDDGQARELRTNVLIGVTAAAAVGTGVIAFVLTDWSGADEKAQTGAARSARKAWSARLRLEPRLGGAATVLEGRF